MLGASSGPGGKKNRCRIHSWSEVAGGPSRLARLGSAGGGQILGKRRQFVGNEEIAFADEQKRTAREEIAFPDCGRGAKELPVVSGILCKRRFRVSHSAFTLLQTDSCLWSGGSRKVAPSPH